VTGERHEHAVERLLEVLRKSGRERAFETGERSTTSASRPDVPAFHDLEALHPRRSSGRR
jgi:hypothetical protein